MTPNERIFAIADWILDHGLKIILIVVTGAAFAITIVTALIVIARLLWK